MMPSREFPNVQLHANQRIRKSSEYAKQKTTKSELLRNLLLLSILVGLDDLVQPCSHSVTGLGNLLL